MALRRSRKPEEAKPEAGPSRVVVVHDDADGCELLVRVLRVAGYQVSRAHDFDELSDVLFEPPPPDGVILDVSGGGIGGNLKLLDAIRQHRDPAVAATRVVLVASSASSAMFSWQAGIDEFLKRPFHADELLQSVADALQRPEDDRRHHRRRMLETARTSSRR
jgi:DNA-binding response OmpR family regulator